MKKYFAPGRINLIGEHIDYNGGLVLPAAISLGITAIVSESSDGNIHLSSATHSRSLTVSPDDELMFLPQNGWLNYPVGVIDFLKKRGFPLPSVSIFCESNLPEGSGLSSSAAIEVLTMYLLIHEAGAEVSKPDLAVWCQEVENTFIGVQCGIMDQFAVANCKADSALLLDCSTLQHEHVPAGFGDFELMVLNTCKPRSLIHSKYNERKQECDAALEVVNKNVATPLANLCQADEALLDSIKDNTLLKRAEHVVKENLRVKQAAKALRSGQVEVFGALLNQSHQSLRDKYEVSGFELDAIVEAAQCHDACIGARMTGAGFGGCAIALVHRSCVYDFEEKVLQHYLDATGLNGAIYRCALVNGVGEGEA